VPKAVSSWSLLQRNPDMDLTVVINHCHHFSGFVYGQSQFREGQIHVDLRPRKGSKAICSGCGEPGPTYDTARQPRAFEFVPLWGFLVFLWYSMRRVDCPQCGVTTERVPWAEGKHTTCNAYRLFLSRWAKRLSWSEVALIFGTSWGVVYRSIQWVVAYGLVERSIDDVRAIGIDEIQVWKGHKYLTVVYQIDEGSRRLLWVGRDRTKATLRKFFKMFGQTLGVVEGMNANAKLAIRKARGFRTYEALETALYHQLGPGRGVQAAYAWPYIPHIGDMISRQLRAAPPTPWAWA